MSVQNWMEVKGHIIFSEIWVEQQKYVLIADLTHSMSE